MELSDLTAYALEKYQIQEQHKWADFPGFSVLCHPESGKWVALLMRQWDQETGTEIQRCDMKCGGSLQHFRRPYLTPPVRMRGSSWVGICFDERTEPQIVYQLLDQAIAAGNPHGFTIVLGSQLPGSQLPDSKCPDSKLTNSQLPDSETIYHDTALPVRGSGYRDTALPARGPGYRDTTLPARGSGYRDTALPARDSGYHDTALPARGSRPRTEKERLPEKLRDMRRLFGYGGVPFEKRAEVFCRQAAFMKDYEDDCPWTGGDFVRYFPTYQDMTTQQLRGYFTWRTALRRGDYQPIPASAAYIYIYELLNGIGTSSPEESLQKLLEFEKGYIDSGIGDARMRSNLRTWMLDFAVLRDLDPELAGQVADPELISWDRAHAVLRAPDSHTDEEVFAALCFFGGKKTENSPVLAKDRERGMHLFAEAWRAASAYTRQGKPLFEQCFGEIQDRWWYPLANAVYKRERQKDRDYQLNECRSFHLRNGIWGVKAYEKLSFNKGLVQSFLHETDARLRRYLKTGRYLREKTADEWAVPYIEAVIEADRQAQIEASRPKITIDFSGLDQIRRDSLITRDSLLTEEDREESESYGAPEPVEAEPGAAVETHEEPEPTDETAAEPYGAPEPVEAEPGAAVETYEEPEPDAAVSDLPLDPTQLQILRALMEGRDPSDIIRENHLMASVAADAINEALFDEIGDTVLLCEGDRLLLLDDYIEDLMQLLGGTRNG